MPSFQIAEGHVEIEADIDHGQIKMAAQLAGRMAGEALGGAMSRGARDTVDREKDSFWKKMLTPSPSLVRALRTGIPDALGSPIGASGLALGVTFAASFISAIITSGMFALIQAGFIGLAGFALRKNEELAGSFKRLGVRASESLERAAEPMIPAFEDALDTIRAMFGPRIEDPLRKIFEGIAPTVKPLAEGVVEMVGRILDSLATPRFLTGFRTVTDSISRELPRLGDSFGELFGDLADNADDIAEGFKNVITVTGGLIGAMGGLLNVLTDVFNRFADIGGAAADLGNISTDAFNKAGGEAENFWGVIGNVADMVKDAVGIGMVENFMKYIGVMEDTSDGSTKLMKKTDRVKEAVLGTSAAMREDAVSAAEALEAKLKTLKEEMDAANAAAEELESTFFDQARGALDLDEKLDGLKEATKEATEAADDHKKVSIEERTALRNMANTSLDVIEAMIGQGKSTDSVVSKTETAREEFIRVARQMGYTQTEARKLADKYGLIPKNVRTKVDLINDERAKAKAAAVAAAIAKIKSKIVTITINEVHQRIYRTGEGGHFTEFAHGGVVGAAGRAGLQMAQGGGPRSNQVMVGEHRPEVLELPFGTRVIPSIDQARGPAKSSTDSWAGSGGSPTIIELRSGGSRLDDLLMEILRESIRVKGGNVQIVLGSS